MSIAPPSEPYYSDSTITLHHGDSLTVLRNLPDASVNCCVTSPPYFGLRDYGVPGQYGLEASPAEYVETMRALFAEVRRVLAEDGTLWLNLGDSYVSAAGGAPLSGNIGTNGGQRFRRPRVQDHLPPKNLVGAPWRVALALQDDGWILRNDIIWSKSNCMPESVTDRVASRHEHVFMFSRSPRYWFDLTGIREPHSETTLKRAEPHRAAPGKSRREGLGIPPGNRPHTARLDQINHPDGRNPGDVWTLPTQPFSEAHFAVMPATLAERCVIAGCKPGGTVLDPFSGSGTTGYAANKHGRKYVGIDLNAEYLDLSLRTRFAQPGLDFGGVA